jgi:hypothetical protein
VQLAWRARAVAPPAPAAVATPCAAAKLAFDASCVSSRESPRCVALHDAWKRCAREGKARGLTPFATPDELMAFQTKCDGAVMQTFSNLMPAGSYAATLVRLSPGVDRVLRGADHVFASYISDCVVLSHLDDRWKPSPRQRLLIDLVENGALRSHQYLPAHEKVVHDTMFLVRAAQPEVSVARSSRTFDELRQLMPALEGMVPDAGRFRAHLMQLEWPTPPGWYVEDVFIGNGRAQTMLPGFDAYPTDQFEYSHDENARSTPPTHKWFTILHKMASGGKHNFFVTLNIGMQLRHRTTQRRFVAYVIIDMFSLAVYAPTHTVHRIVRHRAPMRLSGQPGSVWVLDVEGLLQLLQRNESPLCGVVAFLRALDRGARVADTFAPRFVAALTADLARGLRDDGTPVRKPEAFVRRALASFAAARDTYALSVLLGAPYSEVSFITAESVEA